MKQAAKRGRLASEFGNFLGAGEIENRDRFATARCMPHELESALGHNEEACRRCARLVYKLIYGKRHLGEERVQLEQFLMRKSGE